MRTSAVGILILLALAAGGCARSGAARPTPEGKPYLILVTLDGAGPDVPGLAASRFAREGVTFDRAYAAADEALYGEAALASARYPSEIAPLVRELFRLSDDAMTVSKVLSYYGYQEAGFHGDPALSAARGFGAGFSQWEAGGKTLNDMEPAAAAWLAASLPGGKPLYVFVEAGGGGDVGAGLDRLAGDLSRRGLTSANTTVVITAACASRTPRTAEDAAAALRVPLVIWGSGVDEAHRGRHSEALVSTVDVAPTLLGLARVVLPADVRGRDLRTELAGAAAGAVGTAPAVCAEGEKYAALVRDDGTALLAGGAPAGSPRLLKALAHPRTVDAAGPGAGDRAALCAALRAVESRSVAVRQAYRVHLDPKLKKSLQQHGYW